LRRYNEGLYAWPLALADDDEALRLAAVGGMARARCLNPKP